MQKRQRVRLDVREALPVIDFSQRVSWSPDTTLRMLKDGRLAGFKAGPRSPWRIPLSELDRLLAAKK
jgi:hypothetical protein